MISILCPTRNRADKRENLVKSLNETVNNPNNIELLFIIDVDDMVSEKHIGTLINRYDKLNIRYIKRTRSTFLNRDYYNYATQFAKGDFYWAIGDDVIFLIPNFDKIILDNLEVYLKNKPDKIVCASIKDNTPKPNPRLPRFPCFPLVSKQAVKVLGFFIHPSIPTWGADYAIYCLYKECGRLFEIHDECYLNHVSFHTKQCEEDVIAKRIGNIFNSLKMKPEHNVDKIVAEQVPVQANLILNHIKERQANG